MNGCDLMEELARLKEDRDRLIDEAKALMRERDELKQRLVTEQIMNLELQHEAELAREKRDDAIEYGDTEHEFAESLVKDLHEARNVARDYRDLYAAEIDESIAAFPFPWEAENGGDEDER